jgi:hypothetical protein
MEVAKWDIFLFCLTSTVFQTLILRPEQNFVMFLIPFVYELIALVANLQFAVRH